MENNSDVEITAVQASWNGIDFHDLKNIEVKSNDREVENKLVINALIESIAHWNRLCKCKTPKDFRREGFKSDSCSLCKIFYDEHSLIKCQGCPVNYNDQHKQCFNTPYFDAANLIISYLDAYLLFKDIDRTRYIKGISLACKIERDYLIKVFITYLNNLYPDGYFYMGSGI